MAKSKSGTKGVLNKPKSGSRSVKDYNPKNSEAGGGKAPAVSSMYKPRGSK